MDGLPQNISQVSSPLQSENFGKKIIMFGRATCPDCLRVKKFFSQNSIEYEYRDLDRDKEALDWVAKFSQTIPVIILTDGSILYEPDERVLMEKLLPAASGLGLKVGGAPQIFDTIIIGAGPAGISAAIYAVRKSLKVLILSRDIGGQAVRSGDIENLVGFTMITGGDLAQKFRAELDRFKEVGLWIKEGVEVKEITGTENNFTVRTQTNAYLAKTIIVASGRNPRLLNIPGEKELFGKGVATCATCDAPLFRGRDVAVVGGGNSALDAAFSLSKIARQVTVINITENLKGDQFLTGSILKSPNVTVLNNHQAIEIVGKTQVEGLSIEDMHSHTKTTLAVSGVFIEVGWAPSVDFVPQLAKDKQNQIIVDEFGQTSVPGIWAAGDVNNLWGEQIVIAAGEGAKVALVVSEHLAGIPHAASSNIHEA